MPIKTVEIKTVALINMQGLSKELALLIFRRRGGRSVATEWSKSVAFKAGVSQRRFESGRRQTVTVTACTLWQGSSNLSATTPMTTSDTETDVKLNIYFYLILL